MNIQQHESKNTTMKKICVALFLFIVPLPSPAQDSLRTPVRDSSRSHVQLREHPLLLLKSFEYSLLNAEPTEVFAKYFGPAAMPGTPQFDWTLQNEIDLIQPWKLNLAEQEKYSAVKISLGAAATGGALYLAYRHIKKYGFW